jgi:hypothetical protein
MDKAELESFLNVLPPVDFSCVYGSALHPNNHDKVLLCFCPYQSFSSQIQNLFICNFDLN